MAGKWKKRYRELEDRFDQFRKKYGCFPLQYTRLALPTVSLQEGEIPPISNLRAKVILYRGRRYQLIDDPVTTFKDLANDPHYVPKGSIDEQGRFIKGGK